MTLAQLIAKPHAATASYLQQFIAVWDADALQLPGLEQLDRNEKSNLLTHLLYDPAAWPAIPPNYADGVLTAVCSRIPSQAQHMIAQILTSAEPLAGAQTVAWLETAILGPGFQYNNLVALRILWNGRGPAALPLFAKLRATLDRYLVKYAEPAFETIREEAGISKAAWDLLLAPPDASPEREFESIMERGVTFPAKDWKLLLDHPAHARVLHGLVLATDKGEFFVLPDWPPTAERLTIAHPSMFQDVEELQRWKSRFAAEGRRAPFEQLKASSHAALRLDPVGITAEPSDLFLHLEGLGWTRGRADRTSGLIRTHTKTFRDIGITAEVEYDGVPTRLGGRWSRQTIRGYRFYRESHGFGVTLSEVHPIALSSVMADLAPLQK